MYSPKEVSAYTLCTVQQPHSRDIFFNQNILPLDKLINQQEGILAYKVVVVVVVVGQTVGSISSRTLAYDCEQNAGL